MRRACLGVLGALLLRRSVAWRKAKAHLGAQGKQPAADGPILC